MLKINTILKTSLISLSLLLLTACGDKDPNSLTLKKESAKDIVWKNLISPDFDRNVMINEYKNNLNNIEDPNLKAEMMLGNHQEELDDEPVNRALDGKRIRMPGFIAPLEHNNGIISEFLLVQYAGACIHTPPPPANQIVMIKSKEGTGIQAKDSFRPVWVTGQLKIVEARTKIGNASYQIDNAQVELYTSNK